MNTFGRVFRVSIYGESHGPAVGILIDGCPPGITFSVDDMQEAIDRRRPGAVGTTKRQERDIPELLSGIYNGCTTGAPILINFSNSDIKSKDYEQFKTMPRPGHADFAARQKYFDYNDWRGSGHFSGRITIGLCAAGALARKLLGRISINAELSQAAGSTDIDNTIQSAINDNDSVGAIISCSASGVPAGLGEPFFDSLESLISHIIFSIPGVKGIEFGSGFSAAYMRGSQHNDPIIDRNGKTTTNNSGGINGGISNSNDIIFRVAIKPTSSIGLPQKTYNYDTDYMGTLEISGRHDSCFASRVPVIVESALAIVLADLLLLRRTQSLDQD